MTSDKTPDEGGYWLGTDNELQNSHVLSSVKKRRQSIIEVQNSHGEQVQAMRERFPGTDLHILIKFLKARDYDIEKAVAMYQAHLDWRETSLPIPQDEVKDTLATKKFYLLESPDNKGRPVIFYCFHRFMEMDYVVEDEIKALVYLLENSVIPRFGPSFETQQFSVLIDISGIRSPPLSFLQKMNAVMEANYPESLFRITMFPVPYWLQKIVKGCLVFVAEETRNKFAYVNDVKSLVTFAEMPLDKMGPDVADLVQKNQLK